jgi:hypothetical protein
MYVESTQTKGLDISSDELSRPSDLNRMSQDQARNLKLEIYINLQKTSFFILFEVFDGRYREKHTFDPLLKGF